MSLPDIEIFRGELGDFANASSREWLVTNGIGGFACGTISGARTRRYHGLLLAALKPPLERTLLVAGLDISVRYGGCQFSLATNEFHDDTIHPSGYAFIDRFRVEGTIPIWTYIIGDAVLEVSIWMADGVNTTHLRIRALRSSGPLELTLSPLCTYRDYHHHTRGAREFPVTEVPGGFELCASADAQPYRVTIDEGRYRADPVWYWGFKHRLESRRGLDDLEDLYRPGEFTAELSPGGTVTVSLSTELETGSADAALAAARCRSADVLQALPRNAPAWIQRLALASERFIVARHSDAGPGRTVIAGYPWFGDWGRDTMIALPGLALATRRLDVAADILRTFARHVDRGMLPNRFPDLGDVPEYNTVDATLWYFHALERYLRYGGDPGILAELYPVLVDIIDWHERGTRYGIHVDLSDGLLYAGEPGVQLTWMDAKVGDWVVTPRIGKPVEINALWYRALTTASGIAAKLDDDPAERRFASLAARVARAFQARFWSEVNGHLHDVIDGPGCVPDATGLPVDGSLRPNQVLALAVAPELVERRIARRVIEVCARRLWTPVGLRSLAPDSPGYVGHYRGGPRERDGAYHQGTVWSWLLGPFALAHFHAYGDHAMALSWLEGIPGHLRDACVGQISEIFEGQPPHRPDGCFAQAWSVAEVLRAWLEISNGISACKETAS